jgi:hypothetical protein
MVMWREPEIRERGALEGLRGAELGVAGHEAGHLDLSEAVLEAAEVGLGEMLDLVLPPRRGLLHGDAMAGKGLVAPPHLQDMRARKWTF